MYTWVFTKMEHNSFDKHSPIDPEALYMWGIKMVGSDMVTQSGMSYAEVKLLMQHFRVRSAGGLVGKRFESEGDEVSSALDLFLVQICNGEKKYIPPSYESVRQRASEAMARMEEPDFSKVDDETVFKAFYEVWDGFRANVEWLNKVKESIEKLSNGKVHLIDADYKEFPVLVMGPAEYLMLVRGSKKQKVILGPYSYPVEFVK